MSWLFTSDGQSIGYSVLASVLPINIQGWFSLVFTGFILLFKGCSGVFSSTIIKKHRFFGVSLLYGPIPTSIHDYWRCMEDKIERLQSRNTNSTGTVIGLKCHKSRKSPMHQVTHKVFPCIISAASFLLECDNSKWFLIINHEYG